MRLCKFAVIMAVVTTVSLVYIHMQIQICQLGYEGTRQQYALQELRDSNDTVSYAIRRLTSVNHLGVALINENSDMQFAGADRIVTLRAERAVFDGGRIARATAAEKPNVIARFLSLRSQAEAGPIR